ncbi:MAG TPA: hypothetical protein DCG53_12165, partial [Syntrophus sp. (in: bacteria)]|nr:hypothetical protein [Syntrophus sp. (in: bacteria)]
MVMFKGKKYISKKVGYIGLIILIVNSLMVSPAGAADDSFEFLPILKFTGGILSSVVVHEGAHALVGGVTGTSMSWRVG